MHASIACALNYKPGCANMSYVCCLELGMKRLFVISILIASFFPQGANAWVVKGKWSTAKFNCQGTLVEIGVDMKSRIGGGNAAPVRSAYMIVDDKKLDAAWMVGASMNTVSTNNREHELVLGSSIYLESLGRNNRTCVAL
jgi:hypothetical protein